jgi:O-acetyl-ADP-ribose deacetylase (regulator of RNase III)
VITFVVGDLTTQEVDAVVNAANEQLVPGAGVSGAINAAGGREIFDEAALFGGCPTGQARATRAGRLPARHVIHAVGPIWHGGGADEAEHLASAYRNSLELAERLECRTIAFPALSTGIYGYPVEKAAPIAIEAVRQFEDRFDEIRFVFIDDDLRAAFAGAAAGEA